MKLPRSFSSLSKATRPTAAFTLPEALIATTLFILLVGGIISANLFGMRWYQLGQTEMIATDSARESIGRMTGELRNCSSALVGNVTNGSFLAFVDGEKQSGNSVLIYTSTNTNNYVLYFVNRTNEDFIRYSSDLPTNIVIAQFVTNTNVFQLQDCFGNVLTNYQNNSVVHCTLDFYSSANQSSANTAYQLQTSVAPRAQN